MILIVLTDEQPVAALSRLFSRTAFILMPFSLLFIKYYPNLGRAYDPWTGRQMITGLTPDKNMLGVITFVLLPRGGLARSCAPSVGGDAAPTAAGICWHKGRCSSLEYMY